MHMQIKLFISYSRVWPTQFCKHCVNMLPMSVEDTWLDSNTVHTNTTYITIVQAAISLVLQAGHSSKQVSCPLYKMLMILNYAYVLSAGSQQAPKAWSLLVPCCYTEVVGEFGRGTWWKIFEWQESLLERLQALVEKQVRNLSLRYTIFKFINTYACVFY